MNQSNTHTNHMHFKAAQISAAELSPHDLAMINAYALAPLSAEDVFAFKVSMAGNEIDRDHEVFPYQTLAKFAHLFVGKTVIKDHQHVSDNQIARIYATNLVEGEPMRMTKAGEVYTELIAKCYMVKTSNNADLIAEIQAGIRKEVSLGCRIGKAVCSICGKDNVKQYCNHFPGREYKGETCYFSLEDPTDAYELSFVAIPAQQNAGTVKAYGEKPYSAAEMAEKDAEQSAKQADKLGKRLTVNQVQDQVEEGLAPSSTEINPEEDETHTTFNQVQEGLVPSSTDLNPEEGVEDAQQGDGGEVTSKTLDDFAEKLKRMGEQLDALDSSLERMKAIVLEVMAMGAGSATKEPQDNPLQKDAEHGEGSESRPSADQVQGGLVTTSTEINPSDDGERLTVNQVEDQVEKGLAPHSTELNPEENSAGNTPITTRADKEENQEELKEKQAQARLRALELGLSLRNRT